MEFFNYPLDTKTLLRRKKYIKNELLNQSSQWIEKKIAVLGGSTTNEIVDQLEIALLNYGIKADFYQSQYGQYWEDGIFGNEKLDAFQPDIVYIHTNWRNIQSFPSIKNSSSEVQNLLLSEFDRFTSLWESIVGKFNCIVIQNNFERPCYRLLGNRDIWDYRGKSNFIFNLNSRLYEYAQSHSSFFVNDLDYIAQECGLLHWHDPVFWNMYKYICPVNAIPFVSFSVANIIKSLFGKNKKLIALDLDNTLWGGVVGDDGVDGITIGSEIPQGQSFYDFQNYCKELQQMGVLLAINSKNEYKNAIDGLNHPSCVLKPENFVSIKANWNSKDQNLNDISEELSLGLDSFVFVDDNPAEREIVKQRLPMVAVPNMESAENSIRIIEGSGYFEFTEQSDEDLFKTEQYRARAEAKSLAKSFNSYEDYLESLGMRAVISGFEPIAIRRIVQLTNKTNQFNLTTLRCAESDITEMCERDDFICICGRLTDRFADHGIVTVVAGEIIENSLHIRLWLMSCRVLKRGLEELMMNEIVDSSKNKNLTNIVGYYFPTERNGMVKNFYSDMGFSLVNSDNKGNTVWLLDISDYKERCVKITRTTVV